MAAIIDDGPRIWITDTLNHKLGRVTAAAAGATMLWITLILSPGPARLALAVGAVLLIWRACRPRPPEAAVTTDDLAELDGYLMRLTERFDQHETSADAQYAALHGLVCDIRDHLR